MTQCSMLLTMCISLLLGACSSSDDSELAHYINGVKSRPGKPIEPLPEFKPLPKFSYPETDTRRSPFKPRVIEQVDQLAPNAARPKQPLEAFPLDALKFVGVLEEGPIIWALIKEPTGLVTKAKPGDYMGQNYGQIIQINEKIIKLEESIKVDGKWKKKTTIVSLSLPVPEHSPKPQTAPKPS